MFGARAALVVPGSRIPRPPKREGRARRRWVSSDRPLWPVNAGQKLVPERLFQGSNGRLLCRNHSLKVAPFCWEAVDKSCTRWVGLTDLRRYTLKMFQPLQIPSNKVWTANRPSQVSACLQKVFCTPRSANSVSALGRYSCFATSHDFPALGK